MKSQKKSSEESIHLSSFLPSNVLSELDSSHNLPKNTNENEPNVSKYYFLIIFNAYIAFTELFKSKP